MIKTASPTFSAANACVALISSPASDMAALRRKEDMESPSNAFY
ncbi:MAG: hypothetical protein ABWY13_15295 [Mesorhizobium sp.]